MQGQQEKTILLSASAALRAIFPCRSPRRLLIQNTNSLNKNLANK